MLELADFESVAAGADRIGAMGLPVDMLILNAGALFVGLGPIRGLECHFVINHLGHFILTHRLMSRLLEADQGRVVVGSSNNHREAPPGGIQLDRLSGEGRRRTRRRRLGSGPCRRN